MSSWATQPSGRSRRVDQQDVARTGRSRRVRGRPRRRRRRCAVVAGWQLDVGDPAAATSRLRPRSAPTKRATNSDAGPARISSGVANWARMPPSWKTATRSPILMASSMSWVTNRIVLAMLLLEAQELVLEAVADDRVDRAERLVHEHDRRVGREGPGDARRAGARRRTAGSGSGRGTSPGPGRRGRAAPRTRAFCRSLVQPSRRGTVATFSPIVWCGKSPTCWMT